MTPDEIKRAIGDGVARAGWGMLMQRLDELQERVDEYRTTQTSLATHYQEAFQELFRQNAELRRHVQVLEERQGELRTLQ